jgi:hypothetical protein
VLESFTALGDEGTLEMSMEYTQGGPALAWVTADEPNLPLYAAKDPDIVRWYREDQVINVVRSDPLGIDLVSAPALKAQGELRDVFDGQERVVAVAIQRPYMRRVYVP